MLVCLRVVFQEEHMTTTLTIIRVFKWLSALGLLLTVAIGAAMIDRRFTMLLLPPFFMHTRCQKQGRCGRLSQPNRPTGRGWPELGAAWGVLRILGHVGSSRRPVASATSPSSGPWRQISRRPPASASLGRPLANWQGCFDWLATPTLLSS